jgi:hypothetical protein
MLYGRCAGGACLMPWAQGPLAHFFFAWPGTRPQRPPVWVSTACSLDASRPCRGLRGVCPCPMGERPVASKAAPPTTWHPHPRASVCTPESENSGFPAHLVGKQKRPGRDALGVRPVLTERRLRTLASKCACLFHIPDQGSISVGTPVAQIALGVSPSATEQRRLQPPKSSDPPLKPHFMGRCYGARSIHRPAIPP